MKINTGAKAASKHAFTLIELLVVIAIIAILAAILFPVFAQAREKGRQTVCLSNMKQLSLAFAMYRSDYNETNPGPGRPSVFCHGTPMDADLPPWLANVTTSMQTPAPNPNQPLDPAAQWVPCYGIQQNEYLPYDPVTNPLFPDWVKTGPGRGVLAPYIKNTAIFLCPSDPQPAKMLSYSLNAFAGYIPEVQTQRPAQFIMLVDEQYTLNDGWFVAPDDCPSNAHNNGSNIAFFDAHAKWFQSSKSTITACHNSINLSLYCPAIPFNYSGKAAMCAHE